jgi:hypothetical protein
VESTSRIQFLPQACHAGVHDCGVHELHSNSKRHAHLLAHYAPPRLQELSTCFADFFPGKDKGPRALERHIRVAKRCLRSPQALRWLVMFESMYGVAHGLINTTTMDAAPFSLVC